ETAELVAVCDNDQDALNAAVEKTGVPGFSDLNTMLDNITADIIILTTPSGLHPAQAMACFDKGFHVVTEKPMATRLADGENMVKAADKAGKHLFVVKQNRLNATLQLLKR
ncbi:Gfo/Idh/MocA family protein, partial [Photorhabdus sp. RM126S]